MANKVFVVVAWVGVPAKWAGANGLTPFCRLRGWRRWFHATATWADANDIPPICNVLRIRGWRKWLFTVVAWVGAIFKRAGASVFTLLFYVTKKG